MPSKKRRLFDQSTLDQPSESQCYATADAALDYLFGRTAIATASSSQTGRREIMLGWKRKALPWACGKADQVKTDQTQ